MGTPRIDAQFRMMADAVPQIIWITHGDGRVEYFNRMWREYTGFAYDPATAAEVAAAAVHPDDVAVTMERFGIAQATGGIFEVEHRIRSASGDYRWFLVRASPYRDPATGHIIRWFGASVDIHDRWVAEVALQRIADRQSFQLALADQIRPLADSEEIVRVASALLGKHLQADRVFYGEVDPTGRYITIVRDWTSGTVPSMAGLRLRLDDFGAAAADEVRQGRMLVVGDVTTHALCAASADAYAAHDVRALMAMALTKNGQLKVVLNVHFAAPHRWSDDEIAMAGDMVDRTWDAVERARSQATLRTERDRSRSVFDSMTEGFALLSNDWTVLRMNDEGLRIARRAREDVLGKSHWALWPETVGTKAEQRYRRVMRTKAPETWEYRQAYPDGGTAWIEVRVYPAGERDLAVFFRDVTQRKAVEQTLKEADRRKDEFLAMLAHELRNPLAPVGAAAQLLQSGRLDDARVRLTSQIISRQVAHMTHLIDDLLDVSRVTRGLVELDRAPLDVRHIVADAVEQATPLIQARRHRLSLHLPPEPVTVLGDKKRLVQVLVNILNNAAKYTHEDGAIAVRVEARAGTVMFEVTDNGIGMTPALTAHVFDLFAQAERSADRSAGGLGLGLALVKNLVELHGGSVTCSSDGLDQGSTFCVCLPRIAPAAPADPVADGAVSRPSGAPLSIAIVDDNADAAHMLAMLLESMCHAVTVAHGSREALAMAEAATPDVYLLDIGLPEIDGNALARLLRARAETAGTTLVAVTGYGQDDDRRRTRAAGFDHHLVKPIDIGALVQILAQLPRRRASAP